MSPASQPSATSPTWSLAVACVQHSRMSHARAPIDTKADIAVSNWSVYKLITKELHQLRQIHIKEDIFTRPTAIGSYNPPNHIKYIWVINLWVIEANTPKLKPTLAIVSSITAPTTTANDMPIDNLPNEMESEAAIQAVDKYLLATYDLVVMHPLENHSLMRFNDVVFQENLTSNVDTLIDTASRLNFVIKQFLSSNGFYKYCKAAPKLTVKVANEQRISTDKIFCPTVFTIDGHAFTGL